MVVSSPAAIASRGSLGGDMYRGQGAEDIGCNVESRRTRAASKVPDVTLQPEHGGAHLDRSLSRRVVLIEAGGCGLATLGGGERGVGKLALSSRALSLAGPSAL